MRMVAPKTAHAPRKLSAPLTQLRFAVPSQDLSARHITLWDRIPAQLLSSLARDQNRFTLIQDPLTLLPNRPAFQTLLDGYLQCEAALSLIVIDIDRLKDVNDTLGHDAGDEILQTIADALLQVAKPWEIVARTGGDEFAIILPRIATLAALRSAMTRFQEAVRKESSCVGDAFATRVSLGGAVYPLQGTSRADLMQFADIALDEAKRLGGDRAEIFRQSTLKSVQLKHAMRARASSCLQGPDTLLVYYQPKVDLQTDQLVGHEALIRCVDQSGRVRGPSWISAAFDDASLSLAIGERVRRECFKFAKSLLGMSDQNLKVALNVTPWELLSPGWADTFLQDAACAGVPLTALEIEVTESVVLSDTLNTTMNALELLHARGVRITLDDFGTGFASLAHLRSCPIDALKIDRSFTRNLSNTDAGAIVKAIIGLGRSLNMTVIAEGIERVEQHNFLKTWGCHQGQGFLYGHAIPGPLAALSAMAG